jgi:hypothetical protein
MHTNASGVVIFGCHGNLTKTESQFYVLNVRAHTGIYLSPLNNQEQRNLRNKSKQLKAFSKSPENQIFPSLIRHF